MAEHLPAHGKSGTNSLLCFALLCFALLACAAFALPPKLSFSRPTGFSRFSAPAGGGVCRGFTPASNEAPRRRGAGALRGGGGEGTHRRPEECRQAGQREQEPQHDGRQRAGRRRRRRSGRSSTRPPLTRRPQLTCLLYTSPSPRDATLSRMPSSA